MSDDGWTPSDHPAPPPPLRLGGPGSWQQQQQQQPPSGRETWQQPPAPPPTPPGSGGWQPPGRPTFGHPGAPGGQKTEPLAIWSLVLGIASFVICPVIAAVPAIITGRKGKKAIDASGGAKTGRRMAIVGRNLGGFNIGAVLGLILVAVVFGVAAGKQTTYTKVQPGECFNPVSSGSIFSGFVDRVDCSKSHQFQATGSFQATDNGHYPGLDDFRAEAEPKCAALAVQFVTGSQDGLGIRYVYPNEVTWKAGTREVLCAVAKNDGSKLTGSLSGGVPAAVKPVTTAPLTTVASATAATGASAGFVAADAGFQAVFPATPTRKVVPAAKDSPQVIFYYAFAPGERDDVSTVLLSASPSAAEIPAFLADAIAGDAKSLGQVTSETDVVTSETDVVYLGRQAKDAVIIGPSRNVHVRAVVVGFRLYLIDVFTVTATTPHPHYDQLLATFRSL